MLITMNINGKKVDIDVAADEYLVKYTNEEFKSKSKKRL